MRNLEQLAGNLKGQLLLAHPNLLDPNFRRSVVLIAEHSNKDGAVGVVLNRPLGKTLGDIGQDLPDPALAAVPVFEGGPVATETVLLTAWRWDNEKGLFQLYFGTTPESIAALREQDGEFEVRAYLGYSGWGSGQLEGELSENAWVVTPLHEEEMNIEQLPGLWRGLIKRERPELSILADAPDDPGLN